MMAPGWQMLYLHTYIHVAVFTAFDPLRLWETGSAVPAAGVTAKCSC